ncbi:flagellin N-terminal helical domain-containing protein [Yoonia sp. 2307UL14-13]|uniref:flagellin N-terminal helical domain-containing protein n=1 Tax=Yoonia sp. 2307UL14-13 TaxID=3126506 RepID=UPI0030AEC43D
MSSILTNNSAMVALQTLKSINGDLAKTQSMISTGKEVGSARDNSAVWAISKVMESDVKGFKAISESLSLGSSSVAVARNGAETVTDLLVDMKEKIVAAQGENVDRTKLQADVNAITDQISSVVGAAQFNGLNMLNGTDAVNVLSSLDRASDGTVSSANITVARQDLSTDAGVYGTGADLSANITAADGANSLAGVAGSQFSNAGNTMTIALAATTAGASNTYNLQVAGETVTFTSAATGNTATSIADGITAALNAAGIEGISATAATGTITLTSLSKFDDVEVNFSTTDGTATANVNGGGAGGAGAGFTGETIAARASTLTFSTTAGVAEGDGYRASIGGVNYDYVAGPGETFEDVARGLKTVIDGAGIDNISTNVKQDENTGAWILQIDNDSATDLALTDAGAAGGTATGGLVGLDNLDVTSDAGVAAALANIETYIDTTIDAAAEFGSSQGRIDTQAEFISNLTDNLKSGIGALVDADMEEASARLQALQVQQQLGVQSLSIANQAPQTILSLFR